jgi:hypothetical protein
VAGTDDPGWLRCQETIRKLMLGTGKDALIYAQSALEREVSEPERLSVFWGNARKHYEDSKPKA